MLMSCGPRQVRATVVALALSLVAVAGVVVAAQAKKPPLPQRPAPQKASPPAKPPDVFVGGIQIVNAPFGDDDWSARPFNSANGTKMVLVIKMPEGQGLIELDEDNSSLDTFTDEKTTQYAAEFESFPDVTKDGTMGAIEIESKIIPPAGTATLVADGTLAMTVAAGVKPLKVTNVRLENTKTFKLGTATVTVDEVAAGDEGAQTFTLNLPRSVMASIRSVKFLDAKNQEIEGSRTSSGYMNEEATMGFSVKTSAKTVTMEFEQWQGSRELKVPFKVSASLGMAK
jgi:hypothetical protein